MIAGKEEIATNSLMKTLFALRDAILWSIKTCRDVFATRKLLLGHKPCEPDSQGQSSLPTSETPCVVLAVLVSLVLVSCAFCIGPE